MLAPTFLYKFRQLSPMLLSACKPFQWYFVVTCPECKTRQAVYTIRHMAKREFAKHISIGAINVGLKVL